MKKVIVPLHNGFEETEYVAVRDVLIREGIEVTSISLTGKKEILANHNLKILSDLIFSESKHLIDEFDVLFIPGGIGVENLDKSIEFDYILNHFISENKIIGSICAAPTLLAKRGFLNKKNVTCYPDKKNIKIIQNNGAFYLNEEFVISDRFITGKEMNSSLIFGKEFAKFINNYKK